MFTAGSCRRKNHPTAILPPAWLSAWHIKAGAGFRPAPANFYAITADEHHRIFVRQCLHVGFIGLLQSCIFRTVFQNILVICLAEMVGNRNIPIVLRAFCSRRFGYVELSVAGLNNDWNVLSRAHLVGVKGRPEQITFGLVAFLSVPKIGPCAVILLQKCVVFLLKFLQDRLDIIGIWAPGTAGRRNP